jgi:hypothetical protein
MTRNTSVSGPGTTTAVCRYAFKMIRGRGYQGNVAAAVQFDDEKEALLDAGLDAVFNIPNEAGASLAAHICDTQKIS